MTNTKSFVPSPPVMFPYSDEVVAFYWELDGNRCGDALPFDVMVTAMFPDILESPESFGRGDYCGMHSILLEAARLLRRDGGLRFVGGTGVTSYLRVVGRDADPETFGTVGV